MTLTFMYASRQVRPGLPSTYIEFVVVFSIRFIIFSSNCFTYLLIAWSRSLCFLSVSWFIPWEPSTVGSVPVGNSLVLPKASKTVLSSTLVFSRIEYDERDSVRPSLGPNILPLPSLPNGSLTFRPLFHDHMLPSGLWRISKSWY